MPSTGQPTERRAQADRPIRLGRARAALVVYRLVKGRPYFLLVSTMRCPDKLTLPGGKVDPGETPDRAAVREAAEEAGVLTGRPSALGRYLHRKRGRRVHPTDTFLARYDGKLKRYEGRARRWLSPDDFADPSLNLCKPIRKQLRRAAARLAERCAAA